MTPCLTAESAIFALEVEGERFILVPDSATLEQIVCAEDTGRWTVYYGGSGATYAHREDGAVIRNVKRITESCGGYKNYSEFADICQLWLEFLRSVGASPVSGISGVVAKLCPDVKNYRQDRREGEVWRKRLCLAGRAEVLSLGESEEVEVFDLNSAYPWAYSQNLPGKLLSTSLSSIPENGECAGDVDLHVREGILPPIPYGGEDGYCWPSGKFRTWLCGPELKLAQELGCIEKIHRVWHWESVRPLENFARELFDLRDAAKKIGQKELAGFIKLCLNGVFGLFASKTRSKILHVRPSKKPKGGIETRKGLWVCENSTHPTLYHPLAAGFITSRVRERLYRSATQCQRAVYLGVDSIHTLSSDTGKPEVGVGLGSWKMEGVWDGAIYMGVGRYILQGEHARTRHQGYPSAYMVHCDALNLRDIALDGVWIGSRIAHEGYTRAPSVEEWDARIAELRKPRVLPDYSSLAGE